jgi:hypothetical protein
VLPCLVNRRRSPFPTIPSSQSNLRALCVSALSSSDPCFSPFDFELSTENLISVSPFLATLTTSLQLTENTSTLSSAFATLTSHVNHKPFVCHSYKKHPGVGIPRGCHPESSEGSAFLCPLSRLPRQAPPAKGDPSAASSLILPLAASHQPPVTNFFRIRTYTKSPDNSNRIRTSKTQDLKPFRIRTYKKTRGGSLTFHGSRATTSPLATTSHESSSPHG